jgi:2-polyprenyl-3-methyl-5-hydroxy-6-metoxy-1,4-benzoquinol methylase
MNLTNINTPDYWNRVYLEEWQSGRVSGGDYNRDYGPIHEAIIELVPDGADILDIACGPGLLCRKIKQRLPRTSVTGVDFAQYMIARNEERDRALGIVYRCLDIRTSLRSMARQFDVVCMCEILEHLDQPEGVVADAFALLKPGGCFILTCPHSNHIPDPEHVRVWDHDDTFHLLAPYGRAITFVHFPPPYFHVWMMAHLIKTGPETGVEKPE